MLLDSEDKNQENFVELIDNIYDNVISKYTNLAYSEFKTNIRELNDGTIILPLLSPQQLTTEDMNWITENFPEVIDFLNNHKLNKSVCCEIAIIDPSSVHLDTLLENIRCFYETNRKYLRDIIIGCLIEEILFSYVPCIHYDNLVLYKYDPVGRLKSYITIVRGYKMLIYLISMSKEQSHGIHSIPILDFNELLNNKLFRFHQHVVASLVPIN